MRKTNAYNSIILGFLLGLGAYAYTLSIAVGIIVGLLVTVVGFILIKLLENALYKGVDTAAEKVGQAFRNRRNNNANNNYNANGTYTQPYVNQPTQQNVNNQYAPSNPASPYAAASQGYGNTPAPRFCPACGSQLKEGSNFCGVCGNRID